MLTGKAHSKCHSIHAPYLTDELSTAEERCFESVWFGRLGCGRQTMLNLVGSVALCDVGAAADSYNVLLMC